MQLRVDLVIADQHDEALIVLEEALGIGRRRYPDVTRTWWAARYLARAYGEIGRFAEAVEVAREVVDNYCRILGDDNPITNEARTDYGILLVRSGQPGFGAVVLEGVWQTARDGGRLDEPASLLAGQWLATAYADVPREWRRRLRWRGRCSRAGRRRWRPMTSTC